MMLPSPGMHRPTVVGARSAARHTQGFRASIADGTASIAVGGVIAGGFGVEAAKSLLTSEPAGRWGFVLGSAIGLGLIALGFWLRRHGRRERIGIVVTATDRQRGSARAQQLDGQAEAFSRQAHAVTLKATAELTGDAVRDREAVDRLADETLVAMTLADSLLPDAARINLIPTMPLYAGFWYGARLGHTHAREVVVHAIRQADGEPPYFPAVPLRAVDSPVASMVVTEIAIAPCDPAEAPAFAALALDLQDRGQQFVDAVRSSSAQHGVTHVLLLGSAAARLTEDADTLTAVVNQVCRAWRDKGLGRARRCGVFLSGPVAIAVALGARLAAADHGRWTVFSFDPATAGYAPVPPVNPTLW